jgi:hypothetical protein
VIELVNIPVVPVSVVLLLAIVGPVVVLQQTPLAVIVAPPSAVTLPPLEAVVVVTEEAAVVAASVGRLAEAENVTSVPYEVPALLVAYALTKYLDPAVSPVIKLTNGPVPVPSVVLLFAIVGPAVVLQQTPFAVIAPPPSVAIVPPEVAETAVIALIFAVVIVESTASVVNEISLP